MRKNSSVKKTAKRAAAAKTAPETGAQPKAKRVAFAVKADPGSKVFLAGSFNNWDPVAKEMTDKKGDGNFAAMVLLQPGRYEYKFVVNGTWCADPLNAEVAPNALGTFNSVKVVE